MRTTLLLTALVYVLPTRAQTASSEPARIELTSVAATLKPRDSNGAVVAHADGWTIVDEPLASAQWSFTPSGHEARPALVHRTIRRSADAAVSVETDDLCEAPAAECSKLLTEFRHDVRPRHPGRRGQPSARVHVAGAVNAGPRSIERISPSSVPCAVPAPQPPGFAGTA